MQSSRIFNFISGTTRLKFKFRKCVSSTLKLSCIDSVSQNSYRCYSNGNVEAQYFTVSFSAFGIQYRCARNYFSFFSGNNLNKHCRMCHKVPKQQEEQQITSEEINPSSTVPTEKLSLVKRYKKMMKEYWYVLIPVHMGTSLIWFGSFYYAASCGVDIVPFLEMLGLGETIISPFRNSSLGYIAVASAMYKLATPARYMVTLGGTTISIKILTKHGLIKPVPSKDKLKSMIKSKLKPQESKEIISNKKNSTQ